MSRAVKPLAAKEDISVERLEAGLGRLLFAALWLAVVESLRPRVTCHDGPPSCVII